MSLMPGDIEIDGEQRQDANGGDSRVFEVTMEKLKTKVLLLKMTK